MIITLTAVIIGFILDLIFGDPYNLPHPVRYIGNLISSLEKFLRSRLPKTPNGEYAGGVLLSITVIAVSIFIPTIILTLAGRISIYLRLILESFMCYQILATKSLKKESMKVYYELEKGDLEKARYNVSMIVGRDTENLNSSQVAKAAVETVAENTSDGVIAPLIFMIIGGAPLGFFYKAINTMDSMIGYKNEKYIYFGKFAAKLDDVVNYIPARISAYLMIISAFLLNMNYKGAFKIYKRDRFNHASPNSAHTESVCAGALDIELAGDTYYFGKLYKKPTIGDDIRKIEAKDIILANKLLYMSAILPIIVIFVVLILLLN